MALQTSGQISLNDLHVEAGGTSGTQASINDSDIRALINKASGAQSTFTGFYGASFSYLNTTMTIGSYTDPGGYSGTNSGYNDHTKSDLDAVSWGSIAARGVNGIQSGAIVAKLSHNTISQQLQLVMVDNTPIANSGWTSVTINSTTLNRTAATFGQTTTTVSGYTKRSLWFWSNTGVTSPFGTSGTVSVTIV
jgi:hypothetical protein